MFHEGGKTVLWTREIGFKQENRTTDGADFYDEQTLKYLFSISSYSDDIKVISSLAFHRIKSKYKIDHAYFGINKIVSSEIDTELFFAGKCVNFVNKPSQFDNLIKKSIEDDAEESGYIMYNPTNRTVFFEIVHIGKLFDKTTANDPFKAGDKYKGNIILANVHTHPEEIKYAAMKNKKGEPLYTDKELNDPAYTFGKSNKGKEDKNVLGDGLSAVSRKTARYTLTDTNVDFF